jgi:hypothetical protein
LGYFLPKNSQILTRNFLGKKFLFTKAPFWAIFQHNWAHFFTKRLVTLFLAHVMAKLFAMTYITLALGQPFDPTVVGLPCLHTLR